MYSWELKFNTNHKKLRMIGGSVEYDLREYLISLKTQKTQPPILNHPIIKYKNQRYILFKTLTFIINKLPLYYRLTSVLLFL